MNLLFLILLSTMIFYVASDKLELSGTIRCCHDKSEPGVARVARSSNLKGRRPKGGLRNNADDQVILNSYCCKPFYRPKMKESSRRWQQCKNRQNVFVKNSKKNFFS